MSDRRIPRVGAVLVAALLALAVGIAAIPRAVEAWGGHRFGGRHGADFIQWRASRLLERADATAEQTAKVQEILDETFAGMEELRPDRRVLHERFTSLLTAETVDAAALEALRAEQLARFDDASKRIVAALTEIAQVLSPEQRAEIADMMEHQHRHHRGD